MPARETELAEKPGENHSDTANEFQRSFAKPQCESLPSCARFLTNAEISPLEQVPVEAAAFATSAFCSLQLG